MLFWDKMLVSWVPIMTQIYIFQKVDMGSRESYVCWIRHEVETIVVNHYIPIASYIYMHEFH